MIRLLPAAAPSLCSLRPRSRRLGPATPNRGTRVASRRRGLPPRALLPMSSVANCRLMRPYGLGATKREVSQSWGNLSSEAGRRVVVRAVAGGSCGGSIRRVTQKAPGAYPGAFVCGVGGGGRTRTCDLWVMSPTSCRCSTPRRWLCAGVCRQRNHSSIESCHVAANWMPRIE